MTKKELMVQVARLESVNDQLSSELEYVDKLMKLLGFQEGLKTVKITAEQMLHEEEIHLDQEEL